MIPVLDARGMRRADAEAIRGGVPSSELMENAAAALASEVRASQPEWRRIVVVCGPGNNGGDGLAAARLLSGGGVSVRVFTLADAAAYRGDAAENAARAAAAGLRLEPLTSAAGRRALVSALADADGVVDALFGTGLSRPLRERTRRGSSPRSTGPANASSPRTCRRDSRRTRAFGSVRRCARRGPWRSERRRSAT